MYARNRFLPENICRAAAVLLCIVHVSAVADQGTGSGCEGGSPVACVLTQANEELDRVEVDSDWITAAIEIAIALDAAGRQGEAAAILTGAEKRAATLDDAGQRSAALGQIGGALAGFGSRGAVLREAVLNVIADGEYHLGSVSDPRKHQDILGKLAVARALAHDEDAALAIAGRMPQSDDNLAALKARTLHDIAPIQAEHGDLDSAVETLAAIDMGLTYYRAASRSDVAKIAAEAGRIDLANELLNEADKIAREQNDGYFVAGALRHIAEAWAAMDDERRALAYFKDATDGARRAMAPQQQARALSRIATALADYGYYDEAKAVVPEAIDIAGTERSDDLRYWAYYEIAGAAAFAGDFDAAFGLLGEISPSVAFSGTGLKGAAQRDIAWGLARHGQLSKALATAHDIDAPRMRVQTLSRIARILSDPAMPALPRYL